MSVTRYVQAKGYPKFNVIRPCEEEGYVSLIPGNCQRQTVWGRVCGRETCVMLQSGGRTDYYCESCVAQLIAFSGARSIIKLK